MLVGSNLRDAVHRDDAGQRRQGGHLRPRDPDLHAVVRVLELADHASTGRLDRGPQPVLPDLQRPAGGGSLGVRQLAALSPGRALLAGDGPAPHLEHDRDRPGIVDGRRQELGVDAGDRDPLECARSARARHRSSDGGHEQ